MSVVEPGASLVAQLVKNPPAIQETWVQFLGWEDSLEKRKATHSSILAWRIQENTVHGVTKSWTRLSNFHFGTNSEPARPHIPEKPRSPAGRCEGNPYVQREGDTA